MRWPWHHCGANSRVKLQCANRSLTLRKTSAEVLKYEEGGTSFRTEYVERSRAAHE